MFTHGRKYSSCCSIRCSQQHSVVCIDPSPSPEEPLGYRGFSHSTVEWDIPLVCARYSFVLEHMRNWTGWSSLLLTLSAPVELEITERCRLRKSKLLGTTKTTIEEMLKMAGNNQGCKTLPDQVLIRCWLTFVSQSWCWRWNRLNQLLCLHSSPSQFEFTNWMWAVYQRNWEISIWVTLIRRILMNCSNECSTDWSAWRALHPGLRR